MNVSDLVDSSLEPELIRWLKTFNDLDDLQEGLPQLFSNLTHTIVLGNVEEGATIVGPVHIGESSVVRSNAIIVGPVILGANVVIDHGTIVRDFSYVGTNCSFDSGCIITRSLILNGTVLQPMVSLSSTIVGVGCHLGVRSTVGGHSRVASMPSGTFLAHGASLEAGSIIPQGARVQSNSVIPALGLR